MPTTTDADHATPARTRGGAVALPPLRDVLEGVATLLRRVGPLGTEAANLTAELARVLAGSSELEPHPRDKRFADRSWTDNPGYRRLSQAYLALSASLDNLVRDLEASGAHWRTVERARLARAVVGSTIAPTNFLPTNPAALKRALETGGISLLRGVRNWFSDLRHNGGMPAQVDLEAFRLGRDMALTDGAVIDRTEVAEIIQYTPTTPDVRKRPLVIVPPPIGRFYFLDLRPGRSFVEYALSRGHQVFMVSWRNPTAEQADWGVDHYAARIVQAYELAREVTGSKDVDTLAFCAGGILTTTVLSHLAQTGRADLVHTASLAVTLLDFDTPAPVGAFSSPGLLGLAARKSASEGVISAGALGAVFSWMRPDDLVYGYVVNNYLMGEDPPAFDILAWNADGTNLPATLHRQFLEVFGENALTKPGGVTVLGTPVDLSAIQTPMFVTGARTDHLTPWRGTYRTTQLVGGKCTFALSHSGHVASLVNPPGNPKARYHVGPAAEEVETWEADAVEHTGSWWEGWADWIDENSLCAQAEAPTRLGDRTHRPDEPAPGLYVRDAVPAPA